jgi:hypothetical protein
MELNCQLHLPAALPPVKSPMDRSLGGLQALSGRRGEGNSFALACNRTPAVQPLARRYT